MNQKQAMKKQIFPRPLTDAFTKYGDLFVKTDCNPATGIYCYKRTTSEGLVYYEVFKAPRRICEDGEPHECYPKTSDFGFGTALCIANDRSAAAKVRYYLANGFEGGRWRVQ